MKEITLSSGQFVNLTAAGLPNTRLLLQNQGGDVMYVFQQTLTPTLVDPAYALLNGLTVEVDNTVGNVWVASYQPGILFGTAALTSDSAVEVSADFPADIYTSQYEGFRRLRVDTAETSFFDGREFRAFKLLNIAAGGSYVIRVNVPINVILAGVTTEIISGQVLVETVSGGTQGGTFAGAITSIPRNTMTVGPNRRVAFTPQVGLTDGGTLTGGTVIDGVHLKSGTNQGNQSSRSVGNVPGDHRGVGPGLYYYRFTASAGDAVVGRWGIRWEERP